LATGAITIESASVFVWEWLGLGCSSLKGRPGSEECQLYKVTISGFKAIQAHMFQSGYQLGQGRAKLPLGSLIHQLARV
jgi:hypothetical protein